MALIKKLNHYWFEPARLQELASIALPVDTSMGPISALDMSPYLRDALDKESLLDREKLAKMSVLDIWNIRNLGTKKLIELLVLLESERAEPIILGERTYSIPSESDQALLKSLLSRSDIEKIKRTDARFGPSIFQLDPTSETLKAALSKVLSGADHRNHVDPWAEIRRHLQRIKDALERQEKASLEDDLLDLLFSLCKSERNARLIAQRLGWADGIERTLQEVGDSAGLTRERVRQFEAGAQMALAGKSAFVPKLNSALMIARELAPCRDTDLSVELIRRGIIRSPWPANTLLGAAGFLGIPHGLRVVDVGAGSILTTEPNAGSLASSVRQISRELAQRQGAGNVKEVAFRLSEDFERWVSLKETKALVSSLPDISWLDEVNGWFWFGEPAKSRVFGTIRKILSLSHRISIDDLYEGLIHSYRLDEEPIAPKPVILMLCAQTPWIRVSQRSFVSARTAISWRDELVGIERQMVEILVDAGNALDHYTFKRRCLDLGIPAGSFGTFEGNSPVIRRVSRGIWGVRGAIIRPELLVQLNEKIAAREQQVAMEASRRGMAQNPPGSRFGKNNYLRLFGITAATLRHHVMTLARNANVDPGAVFAVELDGRTLGEVTLTEDRRLRGLLPLLRRAGVKPGQTYIAEFDLSAKTLHLRRFIDEANP